MDSRPRQSGCDDRADRLVPLIRHELEPGLPVWRSERLRSLGVVHAFTGRRGGWSTGARATLDLAGRGSRGGAELEAAERNLARVRSALGVDGPTRTLLLHQVHGPEVLLDEGAPPSWPPPRADALISDRPDALLVVRVADCVPILLFDPGTGTVAAIHSGWRGTVADVVGATITEMAERHGSRPQELIAAIGPAIGADRFEVGPEVAEAFSRSGLGGHVIERIPRPHVDLFGSVRARLREAGLPPESIEGTPLCTWENPDDCFSYRRDGPEGGRMAALIRAPERA